MELTAFKGIGEKTAGAFHRLGIFSAEDLMFYYPRDYETYEDPKPIYALTPGEMAVVEGVLQKDASLNRFKGLVIVNAYLRDMTGQLQLSWYNAPFIKNSLKAGMHLIFRGRVYEKNGRRTMSQPKIYEAAAYREKYAGRLMPVYSLTKGLTNQTIVKTVTQALQQADRPQEYLPEPILLKHRFLPREEMLIRMHFPRSREELAEARRRLVYEEFLTAMLAGARLSDNAKRSSSRHICRPNVRMIRFMAELPFTLTKAQQKAYREIAFDMGSGRVMNRLVEGDVGSGKTIVAILAMMQAALNGYQSALMAPTAVLAVQHYETIRGLLKNWEETGSAAIEAFGGFGGMPGVLRGFPRKDLCAAADKSEMQTDMTEGNRAEHGSASEPARPVRVALLTGSMSAAEKRLVYEEIRNHEVDIIVGTHALFQEKIEYADLGLIVTDEQHRFGVGQREALYKKGDLPHTLVMSATPIPRTLAMILYSDLDISILDARPEGRIPIKNAVVGPSYRKTAYRFIKDEIEKGRQAYVICPAIENEEEESGEQGAGNGKSTGLMQEVNLKNVTEYAEKLKKIYPPEVTVGILHGRMKNEEKEQVMREFKDGRIRILVATTVVEVGVDVPNASVIMIENAERFGLAELHQLRGRVGRGAWQSYCIMINTSDTEKARERLDILNHSNDGFAIAEEDLRLRGPGDIFGVRQSGERSFRTADIYRDADVLKLAKEDMEALLRSDPGLNQKEHAGLKEIVDTYLEKSMLM